MAVIHVVTDDNFEKEVLQSDIPVLVDWMAPYCGPCQGFEMTLNSIVDDYEGRVKFVKVNIDVYKRFAKLYGVIPAGRETGGTPNAMVFKDGVPRGNNLGACSSDTIRVLINDSIPEARGTLR